MRSAYKKECPNCHEVIEWAKLKKIPFKGYLRWYQFTPGSKRVCPYCNKYVKFSVSKSKWMYLPFFCLLMLVGASFFHINNLIILVLIYFMAMFGVYMAVLNSHLIEDGG